MTRVLLELTDVSGCDSMTRLLSALACLGADDEIELISPHDSEALRAVLEERDCGCERLHGEGGSCILLIRRRP